MMMHRQTLAGEDGEAAASCVAGENIELSITTGRDKATSMAGKFIELPCTCSANVYITAKERQLELLAYLHSQIASQIATAWLVLTVHAEVRDETSSLQFLCW